MLTTLLAFAATAVIPNGPGPQPDIDFVLVDTFPDDDTSRWPHVLFDHTTEMDGKISVDAHWCIHAFDPVMRHWYLLQTRHNIACTVYGRIDPKDPWMIIATDDRCFG
jgi:hypothetical protein